jgi:hypothetical protein
MEEFVHRENLKIFKRHLALAKGDAQRQLLLRLLAEGRGESPDSDQIGRSPARQSDGGTR